MSRPPRRHFAAPLILTVAAVPACVVTSAKPNQPTGGDGKAVETRDHRGSGDDPVTISNPPPVTGDATQTDDTSTDRSWSIQLQDDGTCLAYAEADCPPDAKCNPPRPRPVTCPEGIAADAPMDMWANAGSADCYVSFGGSSSCPAGATCNPPPPRKAACPQ